MPSKMPSGKWSHKWALPPLLPGDWRDVTPEDAAEALSIYSADVANEHVPDFLSGSEVERMRATPLSFYPGWMLFDCQLTLKNGPRVLFDFLLGPDGAVLLDGTREPMLALADHLKSEFSEAAHARDYMLFFSNNLRTKQGRFRILISASDLLIDKTADAETRAALKKAVRPLSQSKVAEDGTRFLTTVLYGGGLFYSTFHVSLKGVVAMVEDHLVMEDVPVVPEFFEGPFRLVEV